MNGYWESVSRGAALVCALFGLTDRQRYVVVQRQLCDRSLSEVAAELGISTQAVSGTERRALWKLERILRGDREELLA